MIEERYPLRWCSGGWTPDHEQVCFKINKDNSRALNMTKYISLPIDHPDVMKFLNRKLKRDVERDLRAYNKKQGGT